MLSCSVDTPSSAQELDAVSNATSAESSDIALLLLTRSVEGFSRGKRDFGAYTSSLLVRGARAGASSLYVRGARLIGASSRRARGARVGASSLYLRGARVRAPDFREHEGVNQILYTVRDRN